MSSTTRGLWLGFIAIGALLTVILVVRGFMAGSSSQDPCDQSLESLGESTLSPVQFQNIQGAGLEQYMTGHKQVIVYPNDLKDGDLEYPFSK